MLNTADSTRTQTGHRLSRALAIAALAAMAAWMVPSLQARIPPTEPEQLSLYLNVEKDGKLISGLGNGNFRLYVDGKPVPTHLEKPETPASVALLIEYSNQTGYYIDDMDAAIEGFMEYAPEGHWYALATYARGLTINQDFTNLTGYIANAYGGLGSPAWSEINTYDAVYETLDKMGRLPGRRILIIVGTGVDTFSEHNLDDVKKKIEEENVVVFVAGAGSLFRGAYSLSMTLLQAQAFLQMLAEKSGGFAWFPNQAGAYRDVIHGVLQSIETQYRLVYQSPIMPAGKFHKVKVEAFRIVDDKREDYKVLVRSGWR
jgi:VWFA-related protein